MRKFSTFRQAHTGTRLLQTGLEQHSGVHCSREPFSDKAVQHFPYTLDTPADDILQMLWRPRPGVLAARFPLHLTHSRNGRAWSEIWEILAPDWLAIGILILLLIASHLIWTGTSAVVAIVVLVVLHLCVVVLTGDPPGGPG